MKHHGSWWVDFAYNQERLRRRSPSNSKSGAEAFEAHLRQLVAQHGSVTNARNAMAPKLTEKPMTFAEFTERWLQDYVAGTNSATTQREKRCVLQRHLLPTFGKRTLDEIDALAVHRFIADKRASGLAAKSINNLLTVLRKALDTACDWQLLDHLPRLKFLPVPETTFKFLLPAQVNALIAAADHGLWHSMITIAARTGMRFSELAALEWSAIDWHHGAHGIITVCRKNVRGLTGPPKNNRIRHIPLTSDAARVLAETAHFSRGSGGNLVFTFEGSYIRYNTAFNHLVRICRDAGVPRIAWHDLRHTFASHLVSAGAPLKAIQDLLGHSTIEMTMRYAHLAPDVRHSTIALLETPPARPMTPGSHHMTLSAPTLLRTATIQDLNLCSA